MLQKKSAENILDFCASREIDANSIPSIEVSHCFMGTHRVFQKGIMKRLDVLAKGVIANDPSNVNNNNPSNENEISTYSGVVNPETRNSPITEPII